MSVEAKLSRLSLDLKSKQSPHSSLSALPTKPKEVPESWDDDEDNDSAVEAPGPSLKQIISNDGALRPPPPTPVSPTATDIEVHGWSSSGTSGNDRPSSRYTGNGISEGIRRPEKTTATANRMIAGALGLKAPKKTEEQRQYERAIKEAEIKRKKREQEEQKRRELEDEEAKAAVWNN